MKAPGEEQSRNDLPSAPLDPLVTELAKAESDLERIEAQRTAAKARIARRLRSMHQLSCLFDQGLGWNPEPPVQVPGHGHSKRALVIEHFVNAVGAADVRD